jgi:predicted nucleic-acid-binding protein
LIAVDSSVLLRYLTRDDERQTRAATELLEAPADGEPRFVTLGAFLETIWVLGRVYGYDARQVEDVASGLLNAEQLVVAERAAIERALSAGGTGLADRIIHELGRQAGCRETVTSDRRFARLPGVRLL